MDEQEPRNTGRPSVTMPTFAPLPPHDRESFEQYLERNPDDACAWRDYALFLKNVANDFETAERAYARSVELAPNDATILQNFAVFLAVVRRAHDAAEALYRRALELDPDHANCHGNLAQLLQNSRRDFAGAERHYRQALDRDPQDPWKWVNFASLRLAQGKDDETADIVHSLWRKLSNRDGRLGLRLLYLQTALRLLQGGNPVLFLGQLKTLFAADVSRVPWALEAVLDHLRSRLGEAEYALVRDLAAALGDRAGRVALEWHALWRIATPMPLETPWPGTDDGDSQGASRSE